MYAFDVDNGNWIQKPSLPAELRSGAVAFAINGRGYIGTGYNDKTSLVMQDFGSMTLLNKPGYPKMICRVMPVLMPPPSW